MDIVQTQLLDATQGIKIGLIEFNNPKALNAQNPQMVQIIAQTLNDWADDGRVAMVVMRGTGDKAFCAGGDIKSLQVASGEQVHSFFEQEYALIHQIHSYPKPILAWGHGIVMGGGLGLLAGASHKVVTPQTLMAMPEVSIGLFADAGGSYFLHRMMGKVGLFLGLTGARFNGDDARHLGLADFALEHGAFDDVMANLLSSAWHTPSAPLDDLQQTPNHHLLSRILSAYHRVEILPKGDVMANVDVINQLMNAGDLMQVNQALLDYEGDDAYLKSAIDSYRQGSALTKAITWQIYHTVGTQSLKQVLDMETVVATNCVLYGDFKEGVRALLVDKDKNPRWRYELGRIDDEMVARFFVDGA